MLPNKRKMGRRAIRIHICINFHYVHIVLAEAFIKPPIVALWGPLLKNFQTFVPSDNYIG